MYPLKVIGGVFALAFVAARACNSGEHMEWGKAMQETVASPHAAFAASGYVLLQLLRIGLVFAIVGTSSTGVSTGTFLVTVVRVLLATSINLLVTRFVPSFLHLAEEDVEHLMAPRRLLKASAGGALISASICIWYVHASATGKLARSEPPVLLAIGDWGVIDSEDAGVVPLAMAKFTGSDNAVVLNLGDSFYPDGVMNTVGFRSRETTYASMFGEHLVAQQWHSVLGNHDYRANATLITAHGVKSWLGYTRTGKCLPPVLQTPRAPLPQQKNLRSNRALGHAVAGPTPMLVFALNPERNTHSGGTPTSTTPV